MTYTSQGSRVPGADDLNYTSYIDRLLFLRANQGENDDSSRPSNANIDGNDNIGKVATNFLVKLINETFLSLPIIDCKSVTQIQVAQQQEFSLGYNNNNGNQNYYDACFVDWSKAKLVQNPASNEDLNYSNRNNQAGEILLSNLFESNSILNSPEISSLPSVTKIASKHLNNNISNIYDSSLFAISSNNSNSTINSYYHLAKLTYLSASTILSICGAFINLFIILVIIFNTKQNRISLIRRNNIGQNNLLLFQLTLTGLLLAGYALIDNFSLQYETETWNKIYSFSRTKTNIEDNLALSDIHKYSLKQKHQEELLHNDISPLQLSSFLPPTLFYSNNKLRLINTLDGKVILRQNSMNKNNLRTQFDYDDTYDLNKTTNDHQSHANSLIFIFDTKRNPTRLNDSKGSDNNEWIVNSNVSHSFPREKVLYLDGGGQSKLVDIHDELKSIYIADSSCINLGRVSEKERREERRERQTSINQQRQQEPAKVPIYLNSNINYSNKFIKLYILSLISFLVDVVASVHIWTVAALAYDRYCAIANPLQYLRSIHASRTKTFLIISWTLSIIFNILLPVFMNQINNLGSSQQATNTPSHYNHFKAEEDWLMYSAFNENNINVDDSKNHRYRSKEACQFITRAILQQETKLKDLDNPQDILKEFLKYRPKFDNEAFSEYSSSYNENIYLEQVVKRDQLRTKFIMSISIKFIQLSSKLMKLGDSIQNKYDNIKINQANRSTFIALLIVFSLFSFVIIILIPLLIISICNISIYRIVKVHERRLSVSSGNNNSISVSNTYNNSICNCSNNIINNQRFSHNFKSQGIVEDEKAEANSVTSLLFNKLFSVNFAPKTSYQTSETDSCIQDQENCDFQQQNRFFLRCDKNCDCEKLANDKLEYYNKSESQPNIVNRSKRLNSRRDSYQVLTKSNREEVRDKADEFSNEETNCASKIEKQVSSSCDSIIFDRNQQLERGKLKRKVSDHVPLCNSRKSSNTSHTDDLDTDNRSYIDTPITMYFDGIKYKSGSIMNQLKMAGLSFAGIAIRRSFGQRNNLHKSCSLCNIYKQQQQYQHGSSISRCSVESSPTMNCYKHNKCLNSAYKCQDHQNNKFACQLADNDSDNIQQMVGNTNLIFHPHNGRLPSSFGTKSSAFNMVIWLILTMLVIALPHFLLVTVDRITRVNMSRDVQFKEIRQYQNELKFYTQQLNAVLKFILESKLEPSSGKISEVTGSDVIAENNRETEQSLVQLCSLWLSCLCRILFLGMVPLNGWLYGIKSRSLRTKIRIVLKRYINEKQASIEINKRQRSVSSMRSRDLSFMNLQSINSQQNSCFNCNMNRQDRSFQRCSSFGTPVKQTDTTSNYLKNARSLQSQVHLINSDSSGVAIAAKPSKISSDASIKFVIDEYNTENSSSNNQAQNISINSSLTSSRRSILSTNASTTTSNSQIMIQSLFEQKFPDSYDPESHSFNRSDLASEYTGILTKFETPNADLQSPFLKSTNSVDITPTADKIIILNTPSEDISNDQLLLADTTNNQVPTRVHLHENSSSEISYNQKSLGASRRHSNTDLSSPKKDHLFKESGLHFIRKIKRSTSDFELIVTPVEQRIGQYKETREQLEEGLLEKKIPTASASCADDKLYQANFVEPKRKPLRTVSNWCIELKKSLTKVLSSASAAILNSSSSSAHTIEDGQFNVIDFDPCRCELTSRCSIDSNISSQDQSRVGLLKRVSLNNDCFTNSTHNWIRNLSNHNNTSKCSLRTSYTMNNIDLKRKIYEDCTLKCHCPKRQSSHLRGSFCDKTKRSNSIIEESQTFLKPPSFLKLIFDPKNPAVTYSSSSALSPIKECSSTQHSYASSQSSLNNSQVQQQRKLSFNGLSASASLTAPTLVTQISSENKFETRLVKDYIGE